MKVYVLESGDGSDGNEYRTEGIYAKREDAQREAERLARAQFRQPDHTPEWVERFIRDFRLGGDDWGQYSVEEWEVIP